MKNLLNQIDELIEALEIEGIEPAIQLMSLVRKRVVEVADESPIHEVFEITPEYCSDYDTPYNEDDDDEEGFFDPTDLSDMAWWVK